MGHHTSAMHQLSYESNKLHEDNVDVEPTAPIANNFDAKTVLAKDDELENGSPSPRSHRFQEDDNTNIKCNESNDVVYPKDTIDVRAVDVSERINDSREM